MVLFSQVQVAGKSSFLPLASTRVAASSARVPPETSGRVRLARSTTAMRTPSGSVAITGAGAGAAAAAPVSPYVPFARSPELSASLEQ